MVSNCLTVKLRPAWKMTAVGEVRRRRSRDSTTSESCETEGKTTMYSKEGEVSQNKWRKWGRSVQSKAGEVNRDKNIWEHEDPGSHQEWEAKGNLWKRYMMWHTCGRLVLLLHMDWMSIRMQKSGNRTVTLWKDTDFKKQLMYPHRVDTIWLRSFLVFSYFLLFIFFIPLSFPSIL